MTATAKLEICLLAMCYFNMSSTATTKLKVLAVTVSDVENHIFVFASLKIYIKRGPKNLKNCKTYTAFLHKLVT